jgi:hypothetical protein
MAERSLEQPNFPLGEGIKPSGALFGADVAEELRDALSLLLYQRIRGTQTARATDKSYRTNEEFWVDALSNRQYPTAYIRLDDFWICEWIPFAPGRYHTYEGRHWREAAMRSVSPMGDEYLPDGKLSMVRGGIGTVRLKEKLVNGRFLFFLGAFSSGVAHEGIPIAVSSDDYHSLISELKERGGCRASIVGTLVSVSDDMPFLQYDARVPRY